MKDSLARQVQRAQRRKGVAVLLAGAVAAASVVYVGSPVAHADDKPAPRPNPNQVSITASSYGGNGCPAGTLRPRMGADAMSVDVEADQYYALIGPFAEPTHSRRSCVVNLLLKVPPMFSYSVRAIEWGGKRTLQAGAVERRKSTYFFQALQGSTTAEAVRDQPFDGEFVETDPFTEPRPQSPCGTDRAINVKTQLQLTDTTTSGLHSYVGAEGWEKPLSIRLLLAWAVCPES